MKASSLPTCPSSECVAHGNCTFSARTPSSLPRRPSALQLHRQNVISPLFLACLPSRGESGWLDPRASSSSRRSSPSHAVPSNLQTTENRLRIPPDALVFRRIMNASPAKRKGRDTTTTDTTVTSSTPAGATPALSAITTTISTPATTTIVSPVPASHSSGSPVIIVGQSTSGSIATGSISRGQHHKSKRVTFSCESSTSAHDSPRIVFGPGTISRLPTELGRLNLSKPLIVSSPSRIALARRIQALIPNLESRILDSAVVNVPTRVVDDAVARITGHDVVISVGAGSAIGLAKAVGIRKGIPHVCIPTTYSGSEMSPLLAADGRKMGHNGSKVMPTVIIYDEDLTGMSTAPKKISAPSAASSAAANRDSSHDDDASWSYIHLPGV